MANLYNKYKIEKTDGSPVSPDARYIVFRIDKPENVFEREAVKTFARLIEDREFGEALDAACEFYRRQAVEKKLP